MAKTKPTYEELLEGGTLTIEKPTYEDIVTFRTTKPTYEEIVGEGVEEKPTYKYPGFTPPFGGAYATDRSKLGPLDKLGLPEIGIAIREMVAPTTPYTEEESNRMAGEWVKTLENIGVNVLTLGGLAGPLMGLKPSELRAALREESEQLAGFGPALTPAAGETTLLAVEWGYLYPKLFAAVGATGAQIAKIPKVAKGMKALKSLGGLEKVATKYPRTFNTATKGLTAFTKGATVGTIMATPEALGEEMPAGEALKHISKRAALLGGVSAGFQLASTADTAIYAKRLRNALIRASNQRFSAKIGEIRNTIPQGPRRSAAFKSLESLKRIEMQNVDGIVSAAEAHLMGLKSGKMYQQGQELVETPQRAAERFIKLGYLSKSPYPGGEPSLQKGFGKSEPFIKMPTTRVGEAKEAIVEAMRVVKHPVKAAEKAAARLPKVVSPSMPTPAPAGVSPAIAKRAVEMLEQGWTPGEIDRNLITPSKFLGDRAIDQIAAKERPRTTEQIKADRQQKADIDEIDRELREIQIPTETTETASTRGLPSPEPPIETISPAEVAKIPQKAPKAEPEAVEVAPEAPAAPERGTIAELQAEKDISDEEASGVTKPERRRLIKENAAKIEQSDIYQNEVAGLETSAREVGPGYYYIDKGYKGEVEAIIGKRKGFPNKIQRMFTFDPNAKRVITLPNGQKAEIGPSPWESAVQEGLGRGKEGVDTTWGEMDISEFVQRVVDSYQQQETIGGINIQALERAEQSGHPDLQLWAEKQRMLAAGMSDVDINEMVSEWADEWGIETADIENEYVNEYGTKLRQIKKMEEPDAALEQLATEQIEQEDRRNAVIAAQEVLEANDITAEVEEVEEIPEDLGDDIPFERSGREVKLPEGYSIDKLPIRFGGLRGGKFELRLKTRGQKDPIVLGYFSNYKKAVKEAWIDNKKALRKEQTKREERLLAAEAAGEVLEANKIKAEIKQVEKLEMATEYWGGIQIPGLARGAAITQGQKQVILLAYGADSETGYHEGYHILRRRLTEKSTKVLDKYFKGDEEAEARAFAEYVKTGKTRTFLRGIWQKLRNVLRKVKGGLTGKGFRTAEDIFKGIRSGKIEKAPAKGGVQFETSGEKLRREAEKSARIKARKARLASEAGVKKRRVRQAPRIKLKLQDHTPPLRPDLAPLPPEAAEERPLKTKTLTKPVYTEEWFEKNLKKDRRSILDKADSETRRAWLGMEKVFSSSSTRLNNIAPRLFRATRQYIYDVMTRSTRMTEEVSDFVKATRKMSKDDYRQLDLALKNGIDWKTEQVVAKYGLREQYQTVRSVLDDIYDAAKEVGIDIDYRKDYWPRVLKDPEGFLLYFQGREDWSIIEEAIKRRAKQAGRKIEDLTVDEKAHVVNTLLRGYRTQALTLSRPGPAKERTVESIDKVLDTFYDDSRTALHKYIKLMNAKIAEREFFGRETKEIQDLRKTQSARLTRLLKLKRRVGLKYPSEPTYKEHISKTAQNWKEGQERLDRLKARPLSETIGGYVMGLQAAGEISPTQEKEIQNILTGIFDPQRMGSRMGVFATGVYIDTLNSPLQALTQLDEFAYSFYRSPLRSVPAAIRTAARKSKITPRDIGITSIGEEFQSPSMKRALSLLLKSTGFEMIDRLNKENYINTVLSKYQAQAKRKNLNTTFVNRVRKVFGDDYKGVIEDLRNNRISDNVKYLLFNEILDIQPIAITEMPEAYNKAGNMRILYSLKTFYMKRLDFIRNECFKDMKSKETFARGFGRMVWLASSFALMGAGSDLLKDFIRGKKFDLEDSIADNLLRMAFFSKYQAWRTREKGLGTAVLEGWRPPTKAIDAVTRDIINEAQGKERGWELWRSVPIVGEEYYWWFGEGRRRIEKKEGEKSTW